MKHAIDPDTLHQLRLEAIERVTFYKRDEITTDLIYCNIEIAGTTWTFHEELEGWEALLLHLRKLPNFRADWFAAVSQPPLSACETIAFKRH